MSLFVLPRQAPIQGGNSYPGARLHFYASGSSTTRQATYSDSDRTAAHANPVVADANGVFPAIWLDPSLTYRVRLTTSSEVLIYDLDPYPGTDLSQSQVGFALYPRTAAEIADGVTPNYAYPTGNVLRYGADPTGATDSTAAFNLATRSTYVSTGNFDLNFPSAVFVPAGQYRITGQVWVHKGQHLYGEGEGASRILLDTTTGLGTPIFMLGYNAVNGTSLSDGGGLPPEISNLWMYGGPASHAVVFTGVAGAKIHSLFMTFPGIGIQVTGTDTRVTNCQLDGGLTGIKVGGHTHIFSDILIFSMNYGVITLTGAGGGCSEIVFDNVHFNFIEYVGIQFTTGIDHRNIAFSDCNFALNVQHATFLGFVLTQCTSAKGIAFNDCQFNNMFGFAYRHQTGIDNELYFNDCIFSGTMTAADYAQSTTARVASIASNRVWFNDCEFVGLHDEPLFLNGTTAETRVFIQGGAFRLSTATALAEIGAGVPTNGASFTVYGMDFDRMNVPVVVESAMTEAWRIGSDRAVPMTGQGATVSDVLPFGHKSAYLVDTTTAAATINLPRSDSAFKPLIGDELTFIDAKGTWQTNAVTFVRGDNTISGVAADYVARQRGGRVTFVFEAGGWRAPGVASALVPAAASSFRLGQFSISKTGTGVYTITPAPAFVQATAVAAAIGSAVADGTTVRTFVSGAAADADFYLSAS